MRLERTNSISIGKYPKKLIWRRPCQSPSIIYRATSFILLLLFVFPVIHFNSRKNEFEMESVLWSVECGTETTVGQTSIQKPDVFIINLLGWKKIVI
jgi:hypothetical protein